MTKKIWIELKESEQVLFYKEEDGAIRMHCHLPASATHYCIVSKEKAYDPAFRFPEEEQNLSEPDKTEFIFQSDEYLSETAYTRLKDQIEKSSLKGKCLVVEGLKVIKVNR